ncbi:SCO family protein [Manganibacter manganicus]|uniref:Copper-binding protein n=1 Tax=Manganibacter manganicus TaxID=1873176 RepID=A0A1V8RQZ1_9HYPH|nr:SCO family protein [Pseudaminobacter manganicus]OQM75631.1 copper-binding protein [Pseudaminobacter manganicus]
MSWLRIIRVAAWSGIGILSAVMAVYAGLVWSESKTQASQEMGTALVGGPFRLATHRGGTLSDKDLLGRPYVVFFGFTHCPDVCPTTLYELTGLLAELGPDGDGLEVLFMTVDPERDTAEQLAAYMSAFDPRITALRGTLEETDAAMKAFKAYYRKVPIEGGDYTMDHTAGIILMDAAGRFKGTLDLHEPKETQIAKLRRLITNTTLETGI